MNKQDFYPGTNGFYAGISDSPVRHSLPCPKKQVEQDGFILPDSEPNLIAIMDNISEAVYSIDKNYKILFANSAYLENVFYSTGQRVKPGFCLLDLKASEEAMNEWKGYLDRALSGESFNVNATLVLKGNPSNRNVSFNPIRKGDEITGVACFSKDVSEIRLNEERLRKSEIRFRSLIENSHDGIALLNKESRWIYASPSIERILGFSAEELLASDPILNMHPEDSDAVINLIRQLHPRFGETAHAVYRVKNKSGNWQWVRSNITNMLQEPAIQAFVFNYDDITASKIAKEEIRKNHEEIRQAAERQASIINSLSDHIALLDENGVIIEVNDSWKKFADENQLHHHNYGIGYNYLEISEKASGEDEASGKAIAKGIRDVLAGRSCCFDMEYPCHSPAENRWFKVAVTPLSSVGKSGAVVAHLNITARKSAELQIEFDRKNRDALINNTLDFIWSLDKNMKLITGNNSFLEMMKMLSGVELMPGDDLIIDVGLPENIAEKWKNAYQRALGGESFNEEIYNDIHSGIWAENTFNPILENGQVIGVACYSRDITERKRTEQRLRQSERMMAEAESVAHFGSWELELTDLTDTRNNTLNWSDEVFRIFGYEPGQFETCNEIFFNAVHPDDQALVKMVVRKAIDENSKYSHDHRILKPDGTIRWVHEEAKIILDKKTGKPAKMIGMVVDITERKEAEERVLQAELNYREIFEKASDAIFVHDLRTGKILDVNLKTSELTGYTKEELLEKELESLMANTPGFTITEAAIHMKKAIDKGQHLFEWKAKQKDGSIFWTEVSLVRANIAGIERILAFYRLIDDRKEAEGKLLQTELLLSEAQELAKVGNWNHDLRNNKIFWSMGMRITYGVDHEFEPTFEAFVSALHPEDRSHVVEKYLNAQESGEAFEDEFRIVRSDGQVRSLYSQTRFDLDDDGKLLRVFGISQDITERKLAETSVRISNERYELATKATNDAIWDWNLLTDEVYWSEGYKTLFGYTRDKDEICVETWLNHIHPDDRERIVASLNQEIANSDSKSWQSEYRYIKADNSIAFVYDRGYIINDEAGKPVRMVGAMQDITKRKLTEDVLKKKTNDINKRVKELNCLYKISLILNNSCISMQDILQRCVDIIPNAYQYPEIACARISLDDNVFITDNFRETVWKQAVKIYTHDKYAGSIEVFYLEEKPEEYEGPFLKEELSLLNSLARNITISIEHRRSEDDLYKSEANLRTIFDHTDNAYILLDADYNVLSVNEVANDWTMTAFGGCIQNGKSLFSVIPDERKTPARQMLNQALSGNTLEYEDSYLLPEGSLKWFNERLSPVLNDKGEIIGICLTAKDITGRKIYELEREKMTAEIIQRIKDLEQFAYIVSHNLRAPVANIIGFANLLMDGRMDEEDSSEVLNGLSVSVNRLDNVIIDLNSILQVKREISEKKEQVRFADIVESIQHSICNLLEKEQVVIKCDFSEVNEMATFKSYLYSIFYNLISNSIKYRQPDLPPVIELKSWKNKEIIGLTFKDNGMGIDLERRSNEVFGLYKRFHPQAAEGKGMGLFMVKMQVETLGGKISVSSEVNRGTEFNIEFEM